LTALKGVSNASGVDVAMANAALLECKAMLKAERVLELEGQIQKLINEELSNQQQPVRIFLLAAKETLASDNPGRLVSWLSHYQNYRGVDPANQVEVILYLAEDAMSKERRDAAEWLLSGFLKSIASPEDLETQMRALKVIARLRDRLAETAALFTKSLEHLKACDNEAVKEELPGIELTSTFNLDNPDTLGLAKELLKKHPESTSLKTSIWHIQEFLKESGDERLADWQAID